MSTNNCVVVNDVSKFYGTSQVLKNISLEINTGEIFGLLGPSGAGKTTLVKMLSGIEQATNGSVKVLNDLMPNLHTMGRIGFMAQSDALYEELTAEDNLDFFAEIYGLNSSQRSARKKQVINLVNLNNDINKPVRQFSGGMKRRLSLAISLLHNPEILILDEPTVGIDPILRQAIWDELEALRLQNVTIVVTTHVMDEADKCTRLAMIRDGHIIAVGTPEALKSSTNTSSLEKAFLQYGSTALEV
ncbi:ABC transporter ATP-binding protein [Desulfuribacillus alkaliarsenatis]|uniref:ABC transporter ATP-binding protein n=1 Tax=Desulfuribacillus alkaliarsenatis TaxID=766136 RepID=A0A1E5G334_9FIRM|nr:ABC transporter ATP-binding protein [Desulfuribacillus alkaliarsenatis]OEF97485.1 ABC transporter ATP-binding protein [Desulfuribacillus alkaliarsenatis]